jgi:hypothetical protein
MGVKFTLVRFLLVGDDFAFASCFSPTKGLRYSDRDRSDAATVRYVYFVKSSSGM